jgi:predicted PurR-regulated permease PerM
VKGSKGTVRLLPSSNQVYIALKGGVELRADDSQSKVIFKAIILIGITLLIVLNFSGVVSICKFLYRLILPLLLGAGVAYVLNILVFRYEKIYFPDSNNRIINSTRRGMTILLSILSIILILFLLLRVIIPQFVESTSLLIAGFPAVYDNLLLWINQHADLVPELQQQVEALDMDSQTIIKKGLELLGNWAFGTASLLSSVLSKIVNFLLGVLFGIYILFGKGQIKASFAKLFSAYISAEQRERLYDDLKIADQVFSGYIVGQFKEAVILGVLCTIGMLIFGFPYAVTIGSVVGLTALVPLVGAYIGAAVGFLLIVMVDPLQALAFIVFIVILQQLEGNLIYPKVVGDSIGMPGIWVLASILIGGGLMGITGVLLGVPIAATIYKLLGKAVDKRLVQRGG